MEENKFKDAKQINDQQSQEASGGSVSGGYRGGYCPYTEDRNCRIASVGSFDNNNEDCKYCGWRAW